MPSASNPPLRPIAVHVEEAGAGQFNWVLTERSGHQWRELQTAPAPCGTYHQAMAQGLLALQALVPDLDIGPRQQEAAPSAAADRDSETEPPQPAPKRGSLFGFGPAR